MSDIYKCCHEPLVTKKFIWLCTRCLPQENSQKLLIYRKKSFYCNAVDLLPLKNLKKMMEELRRNEEVLKLSVKDRAKKVVDMIDEISLEKGISLKLRK